MPIENDPSARFQVISRGELRHPGACMICGNGTNDDGYVDLSTFFDYEGSMYLDMTCALQIAELIGCVTPEQIKIFEQKVEELSKKTDTLRKELDDAQHHIDSSNALLRSKFLPSSNPVSSGNEDGEVQSKPEQPEPAVLSEPVKRGAAKKPVVVEPTPFA